MPDFGDESQSRHHFEVKNVRFWRRDPFSSLFLGGNYSILTTSLVLVAIFGWELLNFDDEPRSRRHFWVGITQF
ncbi:hypothetical protein LJB62_18640 [Bacillus sp. DFI.2.34]|nr:hypothetical protein [Bacillus sp. DFI.2.34]